MKNDWIIANINNPDLSAADFKNVGGFTLENTELLPIDTYLKSKQILENPNSPILNFIDKDVVLEIVNTDGKSFTRPWFGQLMTGPQLMAYLIQVNMWLKKYSPKFRI